jgi:hypothetical protein
VAFFLSYDVLSLILRALMPDFDTMPVLLVVLPLAFVPGSFGIDVSSSAISFIIAPLPFIDVAIDVIEFSMSEGLAVAPLSFIDCTIWPSHSATTMAESS